ncbi:glycosyltransferase family 1 protein [Phanerochaete sordida]|uniref:UDP-N-acetylglucosamine transferase subunit ALG14 n=1 Tax=Phanerochaete sordida TaxID=48140 RepID=A0A9P3LHF1_9APHY|nr:glycosyltransferase family 1 protein [Phanerochaete sordida]
MSYGLPLALLLAAAALARLYAVLPRATPRRRTAPPRTGTCALAVFLGSGGHTSEALALLAGLDFARYTPRTYVLSSGDALSAKKAIALEAAKASPAGSSRKSPYALVTIPRARRVHQPLLTTPFSSAVSLAACAYHVALAPLLTGRPFADVLLVNGPGTCVMLCLAVYLNRFLGLPSPKLIYVESFARVKRLSLSGKILKPFVDRFLVQWPDLAQGDSRLQYKGCLV